MSDTRSIPLLLLLLAGAAFTAVVLPRPPSSLNYIPQEYVGDSSKSYSEKTLYQSTNVEKPDTQDYRFLEIELRDTDNVDSLDLHGLVKAVLEDQRGHRLELDETERSQNLTYPHPEVIPHSILGVRDVGLGPSQRHFEATSIETNAKQHQPHYLLSPSQTTKNLGDEKLYYLKSGRPKVYVNFRGKTGNFRQEARDSKVTVRFEPGAFLRATPSYLLEKKTKSPKSPPKKYHARIHGSPSENKSLNSRALSTTTENTVVTSSELPKQIPAPPSRIPSRSPIAHTTPVQRYTARRTDILPGYTFADT